MKKILNTLIILIGAGLIVSCGKKTSPEEAVREYGKYFVEKLNSNQLDSLKISYPDLAMADSIVPIISDTIIVAEIASGQYDLTLAEGITLKINHADDGTITVTESKGLFSFPADKVDIAKKTGMWDDNLSDAQINERIKDEEFFTWFNEFMQRNSSSVLSLELGKKKQNKKWGPGDYDDQDELLVQEVLEIKISNNSDNYVYGKDYVVNYGILKDTSMDPDIKSSKIISKNKPGVDIQPNDSVVITLSTDYNMWGFNIVNPKIELKNSNDNKLKNYQATGKEYQEYLKSTK